MAPNNEKVFMQIMWTCILWQSVSLFPVIEKVEMSENNANEKDLLTNMKYLQGRAISNKASSLALAKLGSKQSRTFLQKEFSDVLKSRQNAFNETEGYFRVLDGKNVKTPVASSGVFSQREAHAVNLQLSPKFEEWRRTVKGKGRTDALGRTTSAVRQTLDRKAPLHPMPLDSPRSFNNPVVNHLPTSLHPSLGELRQPQRKPLAVFTYESKAGGRSDGIQKAAALTANLEGTPQRRVSTMILIISSTFVVLLVTCVTVSIFQCCCRKKSSNEDLHQPDEDKNELDNNVAIVRSRSSIHDTPTYRPLSINSTGDGLEEVIPSALSVRDKIRAFETVPAEQNTNTLDPGKPVRKRPKSKAFEEFENQGIIIGMGKVRSNRPKSGMDPDCDNSNESGLLNEIMASMSPEYNNITMLSDNSNKSIQNGSHMTPDTEISSSYIDDDDEFGEIQRNTHVLRSFKRAAPPKNRSRSKRSSRRRLPLKDSTNISDITETRTGIPDSFLSYEEEKPTDTSVQKVWSELGSPSIHSSESRTDLAGLTGTSANGRTHPANSHTSHTVNGYSHTKEEWPRKRSDKEATPPDKSLTNGNYNSSGPPKGMTTYENPCYESLDIIQANIHRVTETRQSPDRTEAPPTRLPRTRDRQTTPPNKESNISPTREDRSKRRKSNSRISPDSHRSPERNEREAHSRKSPPKNERYDTRANSEKRKSWKEIPPSDSEPRPVRQTHL